jgi:hypothetical protein
LPQPRDLQQNVSRRLIAISGTSDHHHLESVITVPGTTDHDPWNPQQEIEPAHESGFAPIRDIRRYERRNGASVITDFG